MDAGDLRIFEAVARLGGMNRAAAELNTVQSNVTARVRLLEDELGTALFHRHSRGVALTAAGQRLLPYAERLAQLLVDARRAATDDGTPRGRLEIGSLETTAAIRLSPLLASYAAAWPEVDLALRTGTTCELVEQVAARRLEGAFVCGPVDHPELQAEVMFREELVLATARGVRTLDELIGKGDLKIVVLRAGCSYRQRLEDILARRGAVGARLLEFGTIEAILGCVAGGLGVTLMPRPLIAGARHADHIALHALPVHEAHVETLFIRRRDGLLSSALGAFLEHVRPPLMQLQAAE
ncbi:MAG: LysR family transcriptional regulator [Alphaproteobacteria bacterium]|nr:LysR family transcriptional regulator [Alphaproteobacteria bacterium]